MKYKKVIISIGANINNPNGFHPMETCEKAIIEISNFPIFIEKKSSWYISSPVPNSNQVVSDIWVRVGLRKNTSIKRLYYS